MNVFIVLLAIADPLLVAFIGSMIVGIAIPKASYVLMIKRIVSFVLFFLYFFLYIVAVMVFSSLWKYVVMFAPFGLIVITIIISLIVTPKDKIKEQSKEEYKMTGWDTMFPNDIDNDNNFTR